VPAQESRSPCVGPPRPDERIDFSLDRGYATPRPNRLGRPGSPWRALDGELCAFTLPRRRDASMSASTATSNAANVSLKPRSPTEGSPVAAQGAHPATAGVAVVVGPFQCQRPEQRDERSSSGGLRSAPMCSSFRGRPPCVEGSQSQEPRSTRDVNDCTPSATSTTRGSGTRDPARARHTTGRPGAVSRLRSSCRGHGPSGRLRFRTR